MRRAMCGATKAIKEIGPASAVAAAVSTTATSIINRREKGYTLAAVLHDLNQACRYASHLIALREGKIVAQGAPKEIVTAELIERIYGLRCMIIDDPVAGTPLVVPLGRTAPSTANS